MIDNELVEDIKTWTADNFGDPDTWIRKFVALGGLTEEVGELARALIKMEQGIRGSREEWLAEAKKEVGDVFIKLIDTTVVWGFSDEALDVIEARWTEIRQRNWIKNPIGHGLPQ